MNYKAVFWGIDGILYDNSQPIPDGEKELLLQENLEKIVNQRKLPPLKFFTPYCGLAQLMKRIPRERQGIISLGKREIQEAKLKLLGLHNFIDPNLILTIYDEAERIVDTPSHHYLTGIENTPRQAQIKRITSLIRPPQNYIFMAAVEAVGFSSPDCVMVGDRLSCIGAIRTGRMETIYIPDPAETQTADPMMQYDTAPAYKVERGDVDSLRRILL